MLHGFSRDSTDRECTDRGGSRPRSSEPRQQGRAGGTLGGTQRKQGHGSLPTLTANRQMVPRNDFPSVRINTKKHGADVARLKDTCAQPDGAHRNNSAHGGAEHGRVVRERPLWLPENATRIGHCYEGHLGTATISTGLIYKKKMEPNPNGSGQNGTKPNALFIYLCQSPNEARAFLSDVYHLQVWDQISSQCMPWFLQQSWPQDRKRYLLAKYWIRQY